jgi:predicted ATPase/DNA-binding CsgD family transcriptional regulator
MLDNTFAHPTLALTSFVGREREKARIKQLLQEARLLTLTGTGGIGKTRLAAQVVSDLAQQAAFANSIWWINLTTLDEPAELAEAVALAYGLHDAGDDALQALARFLQHKEALLVLDNCERLVEPCARLALSLLRRCDRLHILATSRERLAIGGEVVWEVPPLAIPPRDSALAASELEEHEAVRLFVDRASALKPDFALTEANAAAIVRLCRSLDGLPLAIEMAAAQVRMLNVHEIAGWLDDSLDLLAGGDRLAPPRQQTMRAAIEWSYQLLPVAEQLLWQQLSVFSGLFSLTAVEGICGGGVLRSLSALADKSLVIVAPGASETRYRLLEPLRQYAAERLEESEEANTWRARHRDYYLRWAEAHEAKLRGGDQLAWRRHFESEYANLRAALHFSLNEERSARTGLRLGVALGGFWLVSSLFNEGRHWLQQLLARPGAEAATATRGAALFLAGTLAVLQGDYPHARELAEESHTIALLVKNKGQWGVGYTLLLLGMTRRLHGGERQALRYLSESVAFFREAGDRWGLALALIGVSTVSRHAGDLEGARAAVDESERHWRAVGDPWGIAFHIHDAFVQALAEQDERLAHALFRDNCLSFERLGYKRHLAYMRFGLGDLALAATNFEAASSHYDRSLELARAVGNMTIEACSLGGLGGVALSRGQVDEAVERWQEAVAIFARLGRPGTAALVLARALDAVRQSDLAPVTHSLEVAVAALRQVDGPSSGATREAAFGDVLGELRRLAAVDHQPGAGQSRATRAFDLTERELEVLQLASEGLTDPEIAESLVISKRTVSAHLRSVYRKLDVSTRTAAARLAIERGLL